MIQLEASVGLLNRLLGRPPARRIGRVEATLYTGHKTLEVIGESHHQETLWRIVGGIRRDPVRHPTFAVLMPEPENSYDRNAIKVLIGGEVVGYLSREDAALYLPGLLRLIQTSTNGLVALEGEIVGGGPREDGLGRLGVFLRHDPVDFGVSSDPVHDPSGFRTGFSFAAATDLEDDSYDLSWSRSLSGNDTIAIKQLRTLLKSESDPIDRHYMFSELEDRLYKSRDAFASALDEFDAACEQHDAEMDMIRTALFDKFGAVPFIGAYRQATIRCQKAKDWPKMRGWAERGISVYGEEAARPEWVEYLRHRLEYAISKMEAANRPKPPRASASEAAPRSRHAVETEMLTCAECGSTFERVRTRGRKPHTCPSCQGPGGARARELITTPARPCSFGRIAGGSGRRQGLVRRGQLEKLDGRKGRAHDSLELSVHSCAVYFEALELLRSLAPLTFGRTSLAVKIVLHLDERLDGGHDVLPEALSGEILVEQVQGFVLVCIDALRVRDREQTLPDGGGDRRNATRVCYPDTVVPLHVADGGRQSGRDENCDVGIGGDLILLQLGHPARTPVARSFGFPEDRSAVVPARGTDRLKNVSTTYARLDGFDPVVRETFAQHILDVSLENFALES